MKFVAPEVEVKKFDVKDILTASGEEESIEDSTGVDSGTDVCTPDL